MANNDKQRFSKTNVNTKGGSYVGRNVNTGKDFIGRDQHNFISIVINYLNNLPNRNIIIAALIIGVAIVIAAKIPTNLNGQLSVNVQPLSNAQTSGRISGNALLKLVEDKLIDDYKLEAIYNVSDGIGNLSSREVQQVLKSFTLDYGRIKALEVLAPKIVGSLEDYDIEMIKETFTIESYKDQAVSILASVK